MNTLLFIHIISVALITVTPKPPKYQVCNNGKRVPSGYLNFSGKYYKLKLDSKDYFDSRDDCSYDGATLAMFKTKEDHEAVLIIKS